MARLQGVEPREGGLFLRGLYALVRRKVGKLAGRATVVEPVRIHAHHTRLLVGMGQMEAAQEAARSVAPELKALASIKAATLVGCPY